MEFREFNGYVYILTNKTRSVLYIGVTNSLERRVFEHKVRLHPDGFAARYECDRLIYFEGYSDMSNAIIREKQLKKWKRGWKTALIDESNPPWLDLAEDWYSDEDFKDFID